MLNKHEFEAVFTSIVSYDSVQTICNQFKQNEPIREHHSHVYHESVNNSFQRVLTIFLQVFNRILEGSHYSIQGFYLETDADNVQSSI